MHNPDYSPEDSNRLRTRCPECGTLFHITAEQLGAAAGKVRCGQCHQVFNAGLHLTREESGDTAAITPPEPEQPAPAPTPPVVPEPESDSAIADAPEPPQPDANDAQVEEEPGTEPVAPPTIEWLEPPSPGRWATVAWGFSGVALALALVGQAVWFYRDELARYPQWRPWAEAACRISGCQLASWTDLDRIQIRNREIRSLPKKKALLVNLTLVNQGPLPQPLPVIKLTLARLGGDVIGTRSFRPAEYMADRQPPIEQLPPGQPVQVDFEIADPGEHAENFRFDLL